MVPPEILGPATLAITQSIGSFQAFLPKFTDIRRATPGYDSTIERDVHMGMAAAFLLSMGIGAVVSSMTGSPIPLVISLISAAGLMMLYESVLRAPGEGLAVNA